MGEGDRRGRHQADVSGFDLRVGLFVTCLVDLMRPRIGFAALELLERAGCEVVVPDTQTCCGQLGYNSGESHLGAGALGPARAYLQPLDSALLLGQRRRKVTASELPSHTTAALSNASIDVAPRINTHAVSKLSLFIKVVTQPVLGLAEVVLIFQSRRASV